MITAFRDWAHANGYKEDLTLDRIDVYGNYDPSNCRWATTGEQALNRTDNHLITINGETKPIAQWAKEFNLNKSTIRERILRDWKGEDLIQPADYGIIKVEINGIKKTFREWSMETGISEATLRRRFEDGWRGKQLLKPTRTAILIDFKGEKKSFKELAKLSGLHIDTIRNRHKKGLKDDDLIKPKESK